MKIQIISRRTVYLQKIDKPVFGARNDHSSSQNFILMLIMDCQLRSTENHDVITRPCLNLI